MVYIEHATEWSYSTHATKWYYSSHAAKWSYSANATQWSYIEHSIDGCSLIYTEHLNSSILEVQGLSYLCLVTKSFT